MRIGKSARNIILIVNVVVVFMVVVGIFTGATPHCRSGG